MFGDFFMLESEGGEVSQASRLAFGDTAGRGEAWLRDTLLENPELLPVREIDPAFVPLAPLCRELRTDAGPVDLAFINPHGRLTLVECKLWRNPEARRKVVAQILDYAQAIRGWSYSDLQRQVSMATGEKGNVPFERARQHAPDLDEARFVDDTFAALRDGRFLLLIAGDGIRKDVNAMAEMLNRSATSGFSFGLVEVALYGFEDGALAIQPRVVAKTRLIERTVVVAQGDASPQLADLTDADSPAAGPAAVAGGPNLLEESPKQAEYRRFWTPVLEMTFDDPEQDAPKLFYPNNVRVALPWPQSWILAYRSARLGTIGLATAGRKGADQGLIARLEPHREEILDALPEGTDLRPFASGEGLSFAIEKAVSEFADEDAQRAWVKEMLNGFVNVLRPWSAKMLSQGDV